MEIVYGAIGRSWKNQMDGFSLLHYVIGEEIERPCYSLSNAIRRFEQSKFFSYGNIQISNTDYNQALLYHKFFI